MTRRLRSAVWLLTLNSMTYLLSYSSSYKTVNIHLKVADGPDSQMMRRMDLHLTRDELAQLIPRLQTVLDTLDA